MALMLYICCLAPMREFRKQLIKNQAILEIKNNFFFLKACAITFRMNFFPIVALTLLLIIVNIPCKILPCLGGKKQTKPLKLMCLYQRACCVAHCVPHIMRSFVMPLVTGNSQRFLSRSTNSIKRKLKPCGLWEIVWFQLTTCIF